MRFFIFVTILFFHTFAFSYDYSEFSEKATDTHSLTVLGLGVTSVLLTQPHDDEIRSQWHHYQKISEKDGEFGDFVGTGLVGLGAVALQSAFDENESHWVSHLRALGWGTLILYTMKYSFGRQRPGNSDSHQSFPSGHTTTAFLTATSLTYAYGWKAAVVAYPIAVYVGLTRLSEDAHWGSDIVAGAYLGYWAGRSFFIDEVKTKAGPQSYFFPILGPEAPGLGWVSDF